MNDIGQKIAAFIAAFIGLAVLAIVISARANTVAVLGAFFGGVTNLVSVAISPVTGTGTAGAGLAGGSWDGSAPNASGFSMPASYTGNTATGGISVATPGVSLNLGGLLSGVSSLFGGGGGGGSFIDSGGFS